jgi:glycosyltransferase involved in cell wall biosynthesis
VRIAIDARAYFQRTGIARYTRGLVSALAAARGGSGHEFLLLISDHHRPNEIDLPHHMTAQVSRAPWLAGDQEREALQAEALAWGADLFHAIFPPIGLEALPSVVTVFDLTPLTHPQLHQDIVRQIFSTAWDHTKTTAARLVACSQATRDVMMTTGVSDPDPAVIGIGLSEPFDQPFDPPPPRPSESTASERSGVLFVGTLEPRKKAHLVFDAISLLHRRGIAVPLTIVGKTGWGDQQWREHIPDVSAASAVRCTGYVSDAELLALYRTSAILVCPSEVEGFGLPVLEAMSQGVMPIVSNTPALVELVADPHCIVEPTAAAIADALARWLADAEGRAAIARSLRARAHGYRWSRIADDWLAFYAAVIDDDGSSRVSNPTSRTVSSTNRSHVKR